MGTKQKYVGAILATTAIFFSTLYFPSFLSAYQDTKKLGLIHHVAVGSGAAGYRHQPTLADKINILAASNRLDGDIQVQLVYEPLKNHLTYDQALHICEEEMKKLIELAVIPEMHVETDAKSLEVSPSARAMSTVFRKLSSSSVNMYLWNLIFLFHENNRTNLTQWNFELDAETGTIYAFSFMKYRYDLGDEPTMDFQPERIGEGWGKYLGVELISLHALEENDEMLLYEMIYRLDGQEILYTLTYAPIKGVLSMTAGGTGDHKEAPFAR